MTGNNIDIADLIKHGIIDYSDILDLENMKKKEKVLEVHHYKIWQGTGKDKRWITLIYTDEGKKKIQKKEEKDLYDYLYDYYYGTKKSYKKCTLTDIYEEWINYKLTTCKSTNTVYRLDADYKKFYINEELSATIMTTPLTALTVADIKEWAYSLIKKYNLTYKAWENCSSVLRQVYDYMIDKEIIDKNPVKSVHISSGICRKSKKKKAETQIFYADEVRALIEAAVGRAKEENDAAFLAIPLFFYTGTRIGECLALTYSDIDRQKHVININKMLTAKTERKEDGTWTTRQYEVVDYLKANGDDREVMVIDDCFKIIDEIRKIQLNSKSMSYNLFPGVTPSNVQFKLYRLCESLDLTRRSPHKWRKTYISNLLNKGVDPDFVREQVGHKDIQTTYNSYTYSTTESTKKIEKLQEVLGL